MYGDLNRLDDKCEMVTATRELEVKGCIIGPNANERIRWALPLSQESTVCDFV